MTVFVKNGNRNIPVEKSGLDEFSNLELVELVKPDGRSDWHANLGELEKMGVSINYSVNARAWLYNDKSRGLSREIPQDYINTFGMEKVVKEISFIAKERDKVFSKRVGFPPRRY